MKVTHKLIQGFQITEVQGCDPINVTIEDFAKGQGKIGIECYGQAWSAYWGAMGDRKIMRFFSECDCDYLLNAITTNANCRSKRQDAYLLRIIRAVKEAFVQIQAEDYPRPDSDGAL